METVDELLDAVKQKHGIKSDYKLAAFTGKTTQTIANYRHERSRPDDETLFQLAQLADVKKDEIYVLAAKFQAARAANDDMREVWLGIAKKLQKGFADVYILAVVAMLSIAAIALPHLVALFSACLTTNSLYIMLSRLIKRMLTRMAGYVKKCKAGTNVPRHPHSAAVLPA